MYRYDEFDETLVRGRVEEFRGQVARRLSGALTEDQFKPLRLMNGLYLQLHAYMLRVAVPYGTLSSRQMRQLAMIARTYDKNYGHFTTRQNIQFNWIELPQVPELLGALADVEMHCIQTSGNCIRNVTADPYGGAVAGEAEDPRLWAEIIRQWSTFHPEFSYLPRKFKIAVTGSAHDRAAILVHDIGVAIRRTDEGLRFRIYIGGGQGRTPMIAAQVVDDAREDNLLTWLEAMLRIYNRLGRRDNLYKSRVKILVHGLGAEEIGRQIREEYQAIKQTGGVPLPEAEITRIRTYFAPPAYEKLQDEDLAGAMRANGKEADYARFLRRNTAKHKVAGYRIVTISLKDGERPPGDATSEEMEKIADLADQYSFGEIRVTHEQNLVLAHVKQKDLPKLYHQLVEAGLGEGNIGLVADQIACPGLDFCALANTRSIPVAQEIARRFSEPKRAELIGDMKIKISGCINACGHHHVGHIGILGVDKKGEEHFQLMLGGSADEDAALGKIIGPSFAYDEVVDAVEKVIEAYLEHRQEGEPFLAAYRRLGAEPFKRALYGTA